MGQEIAGDGRFQRRDFEAFARRLQAETARLHEWVEQGALSSRAAVVGLELEAWLVDAEGRPAPRNDEFLERVGSPDVVTELGRFNFELNVPPQPAAGDGLARLGADLEALWQRCGRAARELGLRTVAIGILPTLTDDDLSLATISDRARYRALNQQVLRQRHGRAVALDIRAPGGERLASRHHDVMLEAAATSFQVHLQLPADRVARGYNAALIASAPVVALAANSPLLFGRPLWQETRIPLFEQALDIGTREDGVHAPLARVGLGSGYAGWSLVELFRENAERFEPLLPLALDEDAGRLPHLRLHNGTIWRWNRPLVGFDDDGRPHLRIEHRPMAAGPSIADMMAQLAFAVGLIARLAADDVPPESRIDFAAVRANFHAAARDGLDAVLHWPGRAPAPALELLQALLPVAGEGLASLGVSGPVADGALGLLDARLARGASGAMWQRRALARLGGDLGALTLRYAALQGSGEPLHRWPGA